MPHLKTENGFTLYEMMLAAALSGIVLVAVHAVYKSQQKSYVNQSVVSAIQQNLRGAMCCLQRDIRLAGYDPLATGNFGITDVGTDARGNGTLTFTLDDDLNHILNETDGNGQVDHRETFVFSLYDYPTASPDGVPDLGRKHGASRQLVAQNIQAMGFAYAFDAAGDGDDSLDRDVNGHIIWAVDSNDDNLLDVNLDSDNDGDIDADDDPKGKSLSHPDNGGLADIPLSDIRAVRIWLLAGADERDPAYRHSEKVFVVSNRRLRPENGFRYRLLISTIRCRNLGIPSNH